MADRAKPRRTRVERGIYRQPNGNFAVCARRAGRLHFRTAGTNLIAARRAREDLIAALEAGRVPASPRLRFDTVAARWSERFGAMVEAGDRHARTLEAHRFHLDHDLSPCLGSRRVASIGVEDVADLITEMRTRGARRRQRPTPWRPCRASFASRAAVAGSSSTRLSYLSLRSGHTRHDTREDGCWGRRKSSGCWTPARRAGASWSRPLSLAVCGSPSSSGLPGETSTSLPG